LHIFISLLVMINLWNFLIIFLKFWFSVFILNLFVKLFDSFLFEFIQLNHPLQSLLFLWVYCWFMMLSYFLLELCHSIHFYLCRLSQWIKLQSLLLVEKFYFFMIKSLKIFLSRFACFSCFKYHFKVILLFWLFKWSPLQIFLLMLLYFI